MEALLIILKVLFTILCMFFIFIIVIQPAKGEGITSAFGGGGVDTFFGTKTQQHINKFTVFLAVFFFVIAIVINLISLKIYGG